REKNEKLRLKQEKEDQAILDAVKVLRPLDGATLRYILENKDRQFSVDYAEVIKSLTGYGILQRPFRDIRAEVAPIVWENREQLLKTLAHGTGVPAGFPSAGRYDPFRVGT